MLADSRLTHLARKALRYDTYLKVTSQSENFVAYCVIPDHFEMPIQTFKLLGLFN